MDVADLVPAVVKSLLHFLVLGALLFAVRQLTSDGRALGLGAEPIVVSAAQVERLRADWIAEMRRAPDSAELQASIRRHADEELLLREALRRGLDRSDTVVRQRLVQNVRFARAEPQMDERAAFAEALALGMAHRDLVSRRRLVQAMEQQLAAGTRVSEDELTAYIASRPDRYAAPRRISFEQRFLSSDRHGGDLDRRARELGVALSAGAPAQGDPFLLGASFANQSQADLARGFGGSFAHAAIGAPMDAWTGPIRSAYGAHFIRVTAVRAPAAADLEAVRRQARYALLEERERAAVHAALAGLRAAYPLRIEWPALAMAGAP